MIICQADYFPFIPFYSLVRGKMPYGLFVLQYFVFHQNRFPFIYFRYLRAFTKIFILSNLQMDKIHTDFCSFPVKNALSVYNPPLKALHIPNNQSFAMFNLPNRSSTIMRKQIGHIISISDILFNSSMQIFSFPNIK